MAFWSKWFGDPVQPTAVRSVEDWQHQVLDSELPVIVDLWSPTCGPCKKLVPVLVELATEYAQRVRIVEIDVSRTEPALLGHLGVRSTPTLIVVDGGEEIGRETGFRPKSWFKGLIATEFPAA